MYYISHNIKNTIISVTKLYKTSEINIFHKRNFIKLEPDQNNSKTLMIKNTYPSQDNLYRDAEKGNRYETIHKNFVLPHDKFYG